jgi:hypothetical protein
MPPPPVDVRRREKPYRSYQEPALAGGGVPPLFKHLQEWGLGQNEE